VVLLSHAEHRELATAWGVPFREMPGDPRSLLGSEQGMRLLGTRDPIRVLTRLRDLAGDLFDDAAVALESELADCDAVVFSTLAVAAYHVAELLGIPRMWGVLQPVTATSAWPSLLVPAAPFQSPWWNRRSHDFADSLTWTLFGPATGAYRARVGLPKRSWRAMRTEVATTLPVVGGWSQVLAPRPADWPDHVVVTGAWQLPEHDAPLPTAVEEFLDAGPPPVYMGLGSATVPDAAAVTRMFSAAAELVGQRVILSAGWAGLGRDLESDSRILVVGDLPHAALFGRCAAVVHHAGAGTTHTAAAAGVPAVPMPLWGDQPFWAARSAATGAATAPVTRPWGLSGLAAALAQAVGEPWRRQRAGHLAAQMGHEAGSLTASEHVVRCFMAGSPS